MFDKLCSSSVVADARLAEPGKIALTLAMRSQEGTSTSLIQRCLHIGDVLAQLPRLVILDAGVFIRTRSERQFIYLASRVRGRQLSLEAERWLVNTLRTDAL